MGCVLAKSTEGFVHRPAGVVTWGFHMTTISRAFAFGRSLLADDAGTTSIRIAAVIGLSSSALLILVRIGTAVAMPDVGH